MLTEIYVQARMASTRLPGKIMMTVLGKPLLEYLIERLHQVKGVDQCVILTTINPQDDVIVRFCKERDVPCYRGSEEDVLTRFHQVAVERKPEAIVRITSDCPLIDPDEVSSLVKLFKDSYPSYDYISNSIERSYPRGLDAEIFSFQALDKAFYDGVAAFEREHVTPFIYRHPEFFHIKNVLSPEILDHHRWTVDTKEDFMLIRLILENLYPLNPHFRLQDVLNLLKKHPEWSLINAHIVQKNLF